MKTFASLAAVALLVAAAAHGTTADDLLQAERRQQQLRAQIERVSFQLRALIEDFERNGLDGDDVQTLRAISRILHQLSDDQMQRIVDLLQTARQAPQPAAAQRHVLAAYSSQKNIIVQMRQLIAEHRRRQELQDIALRLLILSDRQAGNLAQTIALAEIAQGRAPAQFDESQQAALAAQTAEQETLAAETDITLARLKTFAQQPATPDLQQRLAEALTPSRTQRLTETLLAAVSTLKAGQLYNAAGNQKLVRDQLRELARILTRPTTPDAILRQAIADLNDAIRDQRQLRDDVRQRRDADPQFRQARQRQSDLLDKTDMIRQDTATTAPAAADPLQRALEEMHDARNAMSPAQPDRIQRAQEKALAALEQARQALSDQLAQLEQKPPTTPATAAARLEEAARQIQDLANAQAQLQQDAANRDKRALPELAPAQDKLEKQTQNLQSSVAGDAPAAAATLQEAARQMARAEDALQRRESPAVAQQAALDALKRAEQEIQQQWQQALQEEQAANTFASQLEKLETIIRDQQKLQADTLLAAHDPKKGRPAGQLTTDQQRLTTATESLRIEVVVSVPATGLPFDRALTGMNNARADLNAARPRPAAAGQQIALQNLYEIKLLLEEQLAAIQNLPPDPATLAEAAAALDHAQQQIADALQQLTPPGPAALPALQQQQQQIAGALQQLAQQQPANAPLDAAQQAAAAAADQLAQGNLPAAVQAMQQAQAGMQAAAQAAPTPASPPAGATTPSLPQLAQQQAAVQQAAQQLMSPAQSPTPAAAAAAAQALQNAAATASDLAAATPSGLPASAQTPVQNAQQALAQAAAQAAAGNPAAAAANALAAQAALAQAQAAMALAAAPGQGQAQGQAPGQGQGQGQGQGMALQPAAEGTGGEGGAGNMFGGAQDGERPEVKGASAYIGLPARDRQALQQSQGEKYPEEYGAMIEQYLRNLADQSARGR